MMKTFTATFIVLALAVMAAVAFTGCGTSDAADGGEATGDGGGGGGGSDGGGGEDTGGGGSTAVKAEDLCANIISWYNALMTKCFTGITTADLPKAIYPFDCANFAIDPAKVDYDENKAGECIAEMNKLGCDGNPDEIAICKEAIIGKVAEGGDCSTDFDCAEGLKCHSNELNTCRTCVKEAGEGEGCDGVPCTSGLVCDDTMKCAVAPALGDACSTGDGALPCVATGTVAQVWCKPESAGAATGLCSAMGVKDDVCATDDECAFFYHCVEGKCAVKPRTNEACTYTVEQGFSQEQFTACLFLYFNDGDYCKPGVTEGEGTCAPVPKKDEACGASDALLCGKDLWCTDLALGGTCADKGAKDAACNPGYGGQDCISGVCDGTGLDGTCAEAVTCQ